MSVMPWEDPRPIAEAPKDRPLLAWCQREEDIWDDDTDDSHLICATAIVGNWIVVEWSERNGWVSRDSCCDRRVEPICFYEIPPPRKEPVK